MKIRVMTADDYDSVARLWTNSNGVGVNPDDSKENISKYLQRNPNTSFDAIRNEGINKVVLVAFKTNTLGNSFWEKQGFKVREDLYYRDLRINK